MVDRDAAIWCTDGCSDTVQVGRLTGSRCGALDLVDQGRPARISFAGRGGGTVRQVTAR